jgi:hypothetical protein
MFRFCLRAAALLILMMTVLTFAAQAVGHTIPPSVLAFVSRPQNITIEMLTVMDTERSL